MIPCGLSKSLGFSSSLKKQQGIVTILGGISSNTSSAPSLKRTFSADLSSKTWLSQNGFSPMKRISSSEKLRDIPTEDEEPEEESRSGFDIWAQIQQDKNDKKEEEIQPGQSDVWSSILSEKKKTESSNDTVPPPYVHPLVKRASSLSEKSLEICTESLGSETGCEGFSSYASSETGDAEIEIQEVTSLVLNVIETKVEETEAVVEVEVEQESITVPNHTIELPRGSFPPPIRSISSLSGSSLHMKTRRDNGRLVLEAVSMPSHNNFSAKRQNGRLLLTFAEVTDEPIDNASEKEDETGSEVQWFDEEEEKEVEEEEEEEEEEVQDEFVYKPNGLMYKPNGLMYKLAAQKPICPIAVHRLAHKPIGVTKSNSRWPLADEFDTKSDLSTPLVHSLPPRPRVAQLARSTKPPSTVDDTVGAACFNACDYYWKPTNTEAFGPTTKTQFQGPKFVNKSIGVGSDGWINGCKERRRSLLSVEAFCIATS